MRRPSRKSSSCGPGHVGDHEVEEALAGLQPRGLAHDRRRREIGQLRQRLGADGLAGALEVLHRLVDLGEGIRGSRTPTGSGAHIVATRLPSAPFSASARTDTGTIARAEALGVLATAAHATPQCHLTEVSTTSLTVPPSAVLMALNPARSASTQV